MRTFAAVLVLIVVFFSVGCTHQPIAVQEPATQLTLRWVKSYPAENQQKVDIGIQWFLSFLGAQLPKGNYEKTIVWLPNQRFQLHINEAGFSPAVQQQFITLFNYFKASDEYIQMGAIDLGRFVSILLLSSPHYYKLTGVPETLEAFINQRVTDTIASILHSTVSHSDRLIKFPLQLNSFSSAVFIATEGAIDSAGNQEVKEFEVMDIMANGQLRFGVYNKDGLRVDFADSALSTGGKPAKCLWCHELYINKNFLPHVGHANYMEVDSFNSAVQRLQQQLNGLRADLTTEIIYDSLQHHTYAELLYLGFMEPNINRLGEEWQLSTSAVEALLSGLNATPHHEFSFLGNVYFRKDVEAFSPYLGLQTSDFAREASTYEPNFLP